MDDCLFTGAQCSYPWVGERDGFCYSVLVDEGYEMSWQTARDKCFQLSPGGDLASIESEEERSHISSLVRSIKTHDMLKKKSVPD